MAEDTNISFKIGVHANKGLVLSKKKISTAAIQLSCANHFEVDIEKKKGGKKKEKDETTRMKLWPLRFTWVKLFPRITKNSN